jgi:hypothetical protein
MWFEHDAIKGEPEMPPDVQTKRQTASEEQPKVTLTTAIARHHALRSHSVPSPQPRQPAVRHP